MNARIVIALILLFFLCGACIHTQPEIPIKPTGPVKTDLGVESSNIAKSKNAIATEAFSIKAQTTSIQSDADAGKKQAPNVSQWDTIKKSAEAISLSGDKLLEESKTLGTIEVSVSTAKSEVDALNEASKKYGEDLLKLQKDMSKKDKEIAEYKDGAKRRQQTIWMSVAGICAFGLLIGIFLAIYADKSLGSAIAISCAVMACVSYFMAAYALLVALAGGILVLLLLAYAVHYLYLNRKAFEETVESFEKVKDKGIKDPEVEKAVNDTQSDTTKKMVHNIRLIKGLK